MAQPEGGGAGFIGPNAARLDLAIPVPKTVQARPGHGIATTALHANPRRRRWPAPGERDRPLACQLDPELPFGFLGLGVGDLAQHAFEVDAPFGLREVPGEFDLGRQ